MTTNYVHRVTLFKIPNVDDQDKLLEKYKTAQQDALKDGKPYIVRIEAGKTEDDVRNQGYTICAKSTFESMEDFHYYDKVCPAHAEIRSLAQSVHMGVMMVYYKSVVL